MPLWAACATTARAEERANIRPAVLRMSFQASWLVRMPRHGPRANPCCLTKDIPSNDEHLLGRSIGRVLGLGGPKRSHLSPCENGALLYPGTKSAKWYITHIQSFKYETWILRFTRHGFLFWGGNIA